ncbi:hypothetical protein AH06_276 [Erwinia phage AH06]|nr:hypothetical protein AH06_276 [Erwinia phage AH06]
MSQSSWERLFTRWVDEYPEFKEQDKPVVMIIVDYETGAEQKAFDKIAATQTKFPNVIPRLIKAKDFTPSFVKQLYQDNISWHYIHTSGSCYYPGHGKYIDGDGELYAHHGGAGDRGCVIPNNGWVVYQGDPANPQMRGSGKRSLEEVITKGSPYDYPSVIRVVGDVSQPETVKLAHTVAKIVQGKNIMVEIVAYKELIYCGDGGNELNISLPEYQAEHEAIWDNIPKPDYDHCRNGVKGERGEPGPSGPLASVLATRRRKRTY